jgi:ABC-type branched-subunit amino acid transport system ATPase component/ABC-type branched-subunit amino acid transport system permease subunit
MTAQSEARPRRVSRFWPALTATPTTVALVTIIGLLLVFQFGNNNYLQDIVAFTCVYAIGCLGLNAAQGNAGLFSMAFAAFMAVGAYTTAVLTTKHGVNPLLAMFAGVACAVVLAAIFSLPTLRMGQLYMAIATIALVQIVSGLIVSIPKVTNGVNGISGIPPFGVGSAHATTPRSFAAVAVVIMGLLGIAEALLLRARPGREYRAIREDDLAAAGLGVPVLRTRTLAFLVHAAYSAVAGAVFAWTYLFIDPTAFTLDASVFVIVMLVLGGSGSVLGAILGAVILESVQEGAKFSLQYSELLYGAVIVVVALLFPGGLAGIGQQLWNSRVVNRFARPRGATLAVAPVQDKRFRPMLFGFGASDGAVASPTTPGPTGDDVAHSLVAAGISKRFGGLQALDDVSLTVNSGTVHALIGPNGSGKSTLINVLSGVIQPEGGRVLVDDADVTGVSRHRLVDLGISRTYQNGRLFAELSVMENLEIATDHRRRNPGPLGRIAQGSGANAAWSSFILDYVGIGDLGARRAKDLGFGNQRRLEMARALALDPDFLLLDEPAAGLSASERGELDQMIRELRAAGMALLVVEHTMPLVMAVADTISVLDFGQLIAVGTPAEIQRHDKVISAYLGTSA